ncbi:MAG: winged helix-turn-helix domain-containing protein [Acidobacteriaceae bacterium]|nr:winged helix-turn-helix domain-containing protein [Acidobacteriaceae bacterium]MBV9779393.1 winged helix-turn-helix domain-containing protein [Acidobacteriaceae bacterium]
MAQGPVEEPRIKRHRAARFGPFELSLETGELRKHGVRVKLQGKPFHILSALIEEPGHVVTREELRARLWPADTFVDFESGLNTAVNRLRIALGDSAEKPIYIETLARLGYRFVAPVTVSNAPQSTAPVPDLQIKQIEPPEAGSEIVKPELASHQRRRPFASVRNRAVGATILMTALAVALVAVLLPGRSRHGAPSFHQVTFRKGFVSDARFTPDGGNVIYGAQWNGQPSRVFLASTVSPEARDLGFEKARLASLSPTAELAIFTMPEHSRHALLERTPLNGGAPRVLSEVAEAADWGPDGNLCLVTDRDSVSTLEFPAGHKLYVARGSITNPRVSPRGDQVALLEHPVFADDAGQVVLIDSSGEAHVLSSGWASARGLAWHPSGREIWFTATRSGANRALMAVDLRGRVRQISQIPGDLEIKDIASSGKVLISRDAQRVTMFLGNLDEGSERDISWLDWSRAVAISADGKSILFDETGEGGGKQYSVYLYNADSKSSERLGEGRAMDLSSDGQWALTESANDPGKLTLVSVNGTQRIPVVATGIAYRWARFFPGAKEILLAGNYPKQPPRIYRQRVPDGPLILVKAGLQMGDALIDPSGKTAVGCDGYQLYSLDLSNGGVRSVKTPQCVSPAAFDGSRTVLVTHQENGVIIVESVDLETGRLTPYGTFKPGDSIGMTQATRPRIAGDLQTFVYSRMQTLSDLFIVSGWS